MKERTQNTFNGLFERYPVLINSKQSIMDAYLAMYEAYAGGHKVLLCGNGGSCADCMHISGELMKGFKLKRRLPEERIAGIALKAPEHGAYIASHLQGALRTIALTDSSVQVTAFCNDVDPDLIFCQQLYALYEEGDVLIGISTSGHARNVNLALELAGALGVRRIGLTKRTSDEAMTGHCDVVIGVDADETYAVQELHLPVYHCLCAMLESEFFEV